MQFDLLLFPIGEAKEASPNIDKLFRLETMSPEAREPLLKEVLI